MSDVVVAGVGMVKFAKPGQHESYRVMAGRAIGEALADAGLDYNHLQQAYGGYIYGDSCSAQRALYDVGMTGIPVINVNNNCASGSTALYLARQAVLSGQAECVLAFGFEEMQPGALMSQWDDRESPFDGFERALDDMGYPQAPLALRCFGAAGFEYMQTNGVSAELFARVAVKSRNHAANNPLALFKRPLTVAEVVGGETLYLGYLTRLMCCPPTCGAGAAIVCSSAFARARGITDVVGIIGQTMTSDSEATWDSAVGLVGARMTADAAERAYEQAGIGPEDVDVVELHDCFTTNEVLSYEALALCENGGADKFVREGENTYGGKVVVNPSGGLMSKGHPIGATGLAQCFELTTQLRGRAGRRQVDDARFALQHNIGLGGAAVVTVYGQPG